MEFKRVDIRTGGESFYAMTNGQFTMYGKAKYLADTPRFLAYARPVAKRYRALAPLARLLDEFEAAVTR